MYLLISLHPTVPKRDTYKTYPPIVFFVGFLAGHLHPPYWRSTDHTLLDVSTQLPQTGTISIGSMHLNQLGTSIFRGHSFVFRGPISFKRTKTGHNFPTMWPRFHPIYGLVASAIHQPSDGWFQNTEALNGPLKKPFLWRKNISMFSKPLLLNLGDNKNDHWTHLTTVRWVVDRIIILIVKKMLHVMYCRFLLPLLHHVAIQS